MVAVVNTCTQVFNMTLPNKGPIAVPVFLDFTASQEPQEIDFSYVIGNGQLDFISGVYLGVGQPVDVVLQIGGTNQVVIIPAGIVGYFPLFAQNPAKITVNYNNAANLNLIFYNFPQYPFAINADGGSAVTGDWLTDEQLRADPVPVSIEPLTAPVYSDESLVMTGGNDDLLVAGVATRYCLIQNPAGNDPITINLAGDDASVSGFVIEAGGSYENTNGISNTVTVSGTAAQTVIAFGAE